MEHDASVNADLFKDSEALSKSHLRDLDKSKNSYGFGNTVMEESEKQRRRAALGGLHADFNVQKYHEHEYSFRKDAYGNIKKHRVIGRKWKKGMEKVRSERIHTLNGS